MDLIRTRSHGELAPELWQQLADHVSQLVWMADGEGRVFWFNRRCSDYTGLPVTALESDGWQDVVHPDDRDRVRTAWFAAVAAGTGYECLYRLRAADGGFRHFLARAEPYQDEAGRITHWFGTNTDVTEQREAQEEANRSAERLRRAVAIADIFLWESDEAAGITSWGENAAELLGVPRDDLPTYFGGGTFFVAEKDAQRLVAEFEQAVAARREQIVFEFRGKDGRYWRAQCRLFYGADGALRVEGATREVTEEVLRRRRSSYLLQLEEVLRASADGDEARRQVIRLLGTELRADRVHFSDPDLDKLQAHVYEEYLAPGIGSVVGTHRFSEDVLALYSGGEPVVIADYREHPSWAKDRDRPEIASLPFRAVLDVPLVRDGRLVSVLSVHQGIPRQWTAEEIELAVATADRSWDLIERLRAEEQLRLSEAQFRSTAEALPGMMFVTDEVGSNLYVNSFYREYAGVTDEEVRGEGWSALIHPDDLERVRQVLAEALAKGQPFIADYRIRRRDGAYRWHNTRATPTRADDGRIVRWIGISLDIHDRLEAEAAARLAADEIAATYITAPIGLAVFDPEFRYVRINERLAEMNGIPAADHIGRTLQEMVPDISQPLEDAIGRALKGEEIWGFEVSGETASAPGVVRTWRENWLPIRDSDGKVTGAAGSVEEITAEKEAERALALSEQRLRLATSNAGVGIWEYDFAADEGAWSEEAQRLLGSGRATFKLADWADFIHPDQREETVELWNRAVADQTPYEAEVRINLDAEDGAERWIVSRGSIEFDNAGTPIRARGVVFDITERHLAEKRRQQAEERFRTIFNSAAVGIGRAAPGGQFLEINDRYCEILGRDREQLLAGGWREVTHPDDLDIDNEYVRQTLAGEIDSYTLEKRYLGTSGEIIWVNLTVSTQRDPDGSVRYFIPVVQDISERKAAEEALRASEERYRALFESMEQGFCIIKVAFGDNGEPADYRFTELNPAFSRQSGLSADVLNRSVNDAVPGLERSWFDRYGEIARSGASERFVDYAEPLGRWFEVYAFRIGEPADHNVAVLFSDVTDRIEREDALRRSEQEMRLRLNAIPQMVWSTRPDGYHDFYNDRWYEFTGTPLGSTDGEGWNGMFHPEDQAAAWERWRHSLATGQPYEIEYRLRHHDGTYRWVLGRALPIRDDAGEIVRWMGTCTDIDDRIEADRALQASEARLRAVIKAMPVGLVFADATGSVTGGNARVTEILGHDVIQSGAIGDYSHDYVAFHANGRQVRSDEYPLAKVIGGAPKAELECLVQRGDGRRSWVRYEAAPIVDREGKIAGGVVASIDIDREKRLTEGLEREVEKVVAEREAAQEALRQSQKLEAMGQLTGGVAHDFNNLLTPIIGSLDLLQRKQVLDDRTGRLVDGALASAEKARVLVQRLLAFARRQPLKPQPIDVGRVVTEMSELVDSTSGPRIRVVTEVPDQLPPALADGNQLEMALLNLSVNARDAMPEGGTLTIAARAERAGTAARLGLGERAHVVLGVSDTGLGMDEETRRRAIEPFFSTKGIGKGTGLGLSMVHGLAAQLGGALDIRSAPGMGTTIELWLPVATGGVATAGSDGGEAEPHGAGTVLLVDDEELVRASTAGMLADLGYRVVEAESGEAAIALLDRGLRPDLLVTDQLMPGLSGTDLAVRLRERFAGLPVLIVSGYADLESLSPAFPHLSKPFRQAELAAALDKVTAADTAHIARP